jgi:hypothetical protein
VTRLAEGAISQAAESGLSSELSALARSTGGG